MFVKSHYRQILVSTILAIALLINYSSCSKENFRTDVMYSHYSGDFDKGGCGWVLEVDTLNYFEYVNLPAQYEVEGLPLEVTYKIFQDTPDCTNSQFVKGKIYVHKVTQL